MEKVSFYGKTIAPSKVSSSKITFMASENMYGKMEEFTNMNGSPIKWKDEAFSHVFMAGDTKENTEKARMKMWDIHF